MLTAWIVGKTDRFRAAVVAKPVINWSSFALTADVTPFFHKYWFGAQPWEQPEQYWKRSPLSLVGNVKTPTMLLTGEADYRTPISESEQYYQALKLRNVDTMMVRIPEASHGMTAGRRTSSPRWITSWPGSSGTGKSNGARPAPRQSSMKFAILGAGALGSILGAHLARAGHDVVMIARGERARVLQRQGLVLNGLSDIKARCAVVDDPRKLRETETLIIATKAIDTAQSIDSLKHLRSTTRFRCRTACSRTSCWRAVFGFSRVLGAMADFSGELLANGEVKFTRNVALHVGEEKGGLSPRAENLAKIIDDAGVQCVAAPDIRTREWSKFVGWIAQFPLAVLTRQITWKYMMDERSASVIVRIVREAAALAAALEIELVDMSPLPVPSIVPRERCRGYRDRRRTSARTSTTSRRSTACPHSRTCCAAAGSNTRRRWASRCRRRARWACRCRRSIPATESFRWRTREGRCTRSCLRWRRIARRC